MSLLRTSGLLLLGAALLALPGLAPAALAQTSPTTKPKAKPTPRKAAGASATPRAATRGTANGQGNSGYAAPGEPINVQDNGKNTPPYDGPAPKPANRTKTTLATPK